MHTEIEIKDRILKNPMNCLTQFGFNKVTMQEIARQHRNE